VSVPSERRWTEAAAEAQSLSDCDQSIVETDQSIADLDQTSSDADQTASHRDQLAAERDQQAADEDQAVSDRSADEHPDDYARSRRARSQSALERDITAQARSETARIRDDAAAARDRLADQRDEAARVRDELAARLDAQHERLELDPRNDNGDRLRSAEILMRAAGLRKLAAATRARSAQQRDAAARDRELAAHDRRQAAIDRAEAAAELAAEGVDHLTATLRRRVGLAAMQRELERTDRSGEGLVIAFVDVVGLKHVNDGEGHIAGDKLLRAVADAIRAHLRPYDLILRYGGDEFVCSLTGIDAAAAQARFERIIARLPGSPRTPALSFGLAERHSGESLEDLIRRGDMAMIAARRAIGA
jgi:diguanylate cyclase (GGDEF)-like protein